MNTSAIAQNLASRGRNGDTTLVHMTPDEVQGLQALAMAKGGSLTINPETGLLEASFLSDTFKAIAPTLIGAGLTYFSGGAINPYMAAGIVGVGEGVRKDDLGAGIMAGLGAYGGAGMAKGLAGMGAGAGAAGAGTGTQTLAGIGTAPVGATAGTAGGSVIPGMQGGPGVLGGETIVGSASAPGAGTTGSLFNSNYGAATNAVQPPVEMIKPATFTDVPVQDFSFQQGTPDYKIFNGAGTQGLETTIPRQDTAAIIEKSYGVGEADKIAMAREGYAPSFRQNVGTGIDRLGQPGGFTALKDNYITAMDGDKRALLGLAGVGASVADGYGAFDQPEFELQPEEDYDYGGPYEPTPRTARFQSTDDILAGRGREFRYFDDVNPYPNVRPIQAAEGGLMALDSTDALGAADEGRFLEGPGDGVSDSIPATVDDEQPVMLSDGEYIMPAEFVSAIGNGSSDAGAAKLTSLVDRVMANTRKVEKGKPNGADNMLKGLVAQT